MPTKKKDDNIVQLSEVRKQVRLAIKERYGSTTKFLETDFAKNLDSRHIRQYISDKGSVNAKVLAELCTHLGLGTLTAETRRITTTTYRLTK